LLTSKACSIVTAGLALLGRSVLALLSLAEFEQFLHISAKQHQQRYTFMSSNSCDYGPVATALAGSAVMGINYLKSSLTKSTFSITL